MSRLRLLFVCVENANRSQLAAGFARLHGGEAVAAESAGSRPASQINPRALRLLGRRGLDTAGLKPRSLDEAGPGPWDAVITMGCSDSCPSSDAGIRENWALPDPRELPEAEYRKVAADIEQRVLGLLARLGHDRAGYRVIPRRQAWVALALFLGLCAIGGVFGVQWAGAWAEALVADALAGDPQEITRLASQVRTLVLLMVLPLFGSAAWLAFSGHRAIRAALMPPPGSWVVQGQQTWVGPAAIRRGQAMVFASVLLLLLTLAMILTMLKLAARLPALAS